MDDVETTVVALTVSDDTSTTHVATTRDHGNSASVELDGVGDLARGQVNLDGVVDLDAGVRVTNAAKTQELASVESRGTYQPSVRSSILSQDGKKVVQPKLDPTAE